MEEYRKQEVSTDLRHLPPHRYRLVVNCRNSRKASPAQASPRKFYLTVLSSRSIRKCLKIKSRCHVYPSQNWRGYFAVFGSFQPWF